jgi:hypothetical protein
MSRRVCSLPANASGVAPHRASISSRFGQVIVVLFLNIAVAILVDSYVSVKEADAARVSDEKFLGHRRLRRLVNRLKRPQGGRLCGCAGCPWVQLRARIQPRLNSGSYRQRSVEPALSHQRVGDRVASDVAETVTSANQKTKIADEFSFLDAADDEEGAANGAAAGPTGATTDQEPSRLHKVPTSGLGSWTPASQSWHQAAPIGLEGLCQLLEDLGSESTANESEEVWIDGYEICLRLAMLGAPKLVSCELCRVFGRRLPPPSRSSTSPPTATGTGSVVHGNRHHRHVQAAHPARERTMGEVAAAVAVSLKRRLDESPWLQFTSECQRC